MYGVLALLSLVASASAQAVTELIVPSSAPLAGCLNSRQGVFYLNIVNATGFATSSPTPARRSFDEVKRRDLGSFLLPRQQLDGLLTLSLTGGVLTDQANRTGYIASNYQFQFDGPPQAGAIYTAGWSICGNGTLSLGGQSVFWQCLSGSFYNLYDRNFAAHCLPIYLVTSGTGSTYSTSPPGPVSTGPDQNTIANGGGTQSPSAAATSSSAAASSASAEASATSESVSAAVSSSASQASSSASEAASSASSAVSSAAETPVNVASSALAPKATAASQQYFAWAAGVVGAMVLA